MEVFSEGHTVAIGTYICNIEKQSSTAKEKS